MGLPRAHLEGVLPKSTFSKGVLNGDGTDTVLAMDNSGAAK
jgi:hypothetical protein